MTQTETSTATGSAATAVDAIDGLSWLTGTWRGPLGDQLLEEQWSVAQAGSIAALVRFFQGSETQIVELLTISESSDGLEMLIQQWSGEMQPLNPAPQRMALDQQSHRSISFKSASSGGMKHLHYSSPDDSTLLIAVELTEGTRFDLRLQRFAN
ncbi:MAG: DUF6265 family protein [Pseudomonadales bacterium]